MQLSSAFSFGLLFNIRDIPSAGIQEQTLEHLRALVSRLAVICSRKDALFKHGLAYPSSRQQASPFREPRADL